MTMNRNIEDGLEAIEALHEDLYNRCKAEFYRGTVRVFNAVRLLASRGYLTKFERAPAEVLTAERHFTLKRYWQDFNASPYSPVLLIPPLMVNPQIYDLRPRHSFVRHLLNFDFDVFLIDFGAPTSRDSHLKLDDYVTNIGRAVEKIRETTGASKVTLIGYCMGGIFGNMYAPLVGNETVKNIVAIGAPADFTRIPKYYSLAQSMDRPVLSIADMLGGVPPAVSRAVFQMLQPLKNVALPVNLMMNLWDEDYVAAYESMERWFEDFVAYPQEAFKQFFIEVVKENRLFRSQLMINGERVDLKKIKVPYLVLAGKDDFIGHPASVRPIMDVIGSADKTYQAVGGGHLGMLSGKNAPHTWTLIAHWLIPRSSLRKKPLKNPLPALNGNGNGRKPARSKSKRNISQNRVDI